MEHADYFWRHIFYHAQIQIEKFNFKLRSKLEIEDAHVKCFPQFNYHVRRQRETCGKKVGYVKERCKNKQCCKILCGGIEQSKIKWITFENLIRPSVKGRIAVENLIGKTNNEAYFIWTNTQCIAQRVDVLQGKLITVSLEATFLWLSERREWRCYNEIIQSLHNIRNRAGEFRVLLEINFEVSANEQGEKSVTRSFHEPSHWVTTSHMRKTAPTNIW